MIILEKIRQLYPQFTKSQRRLADFLATSYQEAAFMTASRLAHRLALNEATVIRFAQRLGYSGYPELMQDIQSVVRGELRAKYETGEAAAAPDPFATLLNNEVEALQQAMSQVAPELAREALNMLRGAQRVHVLGQGLAAPLAQLLAFSLRSLGLNAECLPADPPSLALFLGEIDARSAMVGIAVDFPAAFGSLETANALRAAGQRGAHTLALSGSPISPCAQSAELAISLPPPEMLVWPSVAAMATLIDAVVQSLAAEDSAGVRSRIEWLNQAQESVLTKRRR